MKKRVLKASIAKDFEKWLLNATLKEKEEFCKEMNAYAESLRRSNG
jgi:hypothetical protein